VREGMPKQYAVALSYASQHRSLIHDVAARLSSVLGERGGRVFYDLYEKTQLVGPILKVLQDAYARKSSVVVVFWSQHYHDNDWCQKEWRVIRPFLHRKRSSGTRLLLLRLDDARIPGLKPPNTATNVNDQGAEFIANLILRFTGTNPWIVDAPFAVDRLSALQSRRLSRLFDPELRLQGARLKHEYDEGDKWRAGPLVAALKPFKLDWTDSNSKTLPANIVVLSGPSGAGKSVLLLRAIATAENPQALFRDSWLFDFARNKSSCTRDTFRSTAAEHLEEFLRGSLKHSRRNRHVLLVIDGLDSAARYTSTANSGGPTAPQLTCDALESMFGVLHSVARRTRADFTVVVCLNAIDLSQKLGPWDLVYSLLDSSGAEFAALGELPAVGDDAEPYSHHLDLKDRSHKSVAKYVNDQRTFLRLPLFLDVASYLSADSLEGCSSRMDFLRSAREKRSVVWPNELDEIARDLGDFMSTDSLRLLANSKERNLLTREWTEAWVDLLTESMRLRHVRGLLSDLMKKLTEDDRWRWELSSTFALSNIVTALSEAGHAPRFKTALRYWNLRRATLDKAVFAATSNFLAVDCTGARLLEVTFDDGCSFVATDFTGCQWSKPPPDGKAPLFVSCLGLQGAD
jgi:TIR domain